MYMTSADPTKAEVFETSPLTLITIGATVTVALVGILAILMTALACAVISLYKRGREGTSGLKLHKRTSKYYQPENSSTERYVVKLSMHTVNICDTFFVIELR